LTKLARNEDGLIRGRDDKGRVIYKRFRGKSLARELMERNRKK